MLVFRASLWKKTISATVEVQRVRIAAAWRTGGSLSVLLAQKENQQA
jgi:hypothetical protein